MNNKNEHREYSMYQLANTRNDDSSMWVTDDDDDFKKVNNLSSLHLNKIEIIFFFLIELIFFC
jgi:hypothetical protein